MAKLPGAVQGARIVGERYLRSQRQHHPERRMPLTEHLRELRNRVVKMMLGLTAGMVIGFIFFNSLWRVIEHPLCSAVIRGHTGCQTIGVNQLVLSGPLDSFYLRVKVAVIAGAIVSSPVWLYQVWAFVGPGLHAREKRWTYAFLGTSVPLFLTGFTLAYWSLGRSMHYLLDLTPSHVSNLIQVDQYELRPDHAAGLRPRLRGAAAHRHAEPGRHLDHERYRTSRRVLLFAVFLIAGIASPSPDPVTMLILGGGCAVLVEAAELTVWANDRRRARLHPDPYAGLADDELSPIDAHDAQTRDNIYS